MEIKLFCLFTRAVTMQATLSSPSRSSSFSSSTNASSANTTLANQNLTGSAKKRISTKDAALRKACEGALSKQARQKNNAVKSHSIQAPTMSEASNCFEVAQFMAAKRFDSVILINNKGELRGIVTDKDLAFKLAANGLDSRKTPIASIMTSNPLCITPDCSMTEALSLMNAHKFRHLPIVSEQGVEGILDIAKCLYEAVEKLERADQAARNLASALQSATKEFKSAETFGAANISDLLQQKISKKPLELKNSQIPKVSFKCTVLESVQAMLENRSSAVLIVDDNKLRGIFTTKDVVLRVLAASLDPQTTSVIRVMTPHPECFSSACSAVDALKKMQQGHFLHLPVIKDDSEESPQKISNVVGLVDSLEISIQVMNQLDGLCNGEQSMLWNSKEESISSDKDFILEPITKDTRVDLLKCKIKGANNSFFVKNTNFPTLINSIKSRVNSRFSLSFENNGELMRLDNEDDFAAFTKSNCKDFFVTIQKSNFVFALGTFAAIAGISAFYFFKNK